jgi:hypothetical protein
MTTLPPPLKGSLTRDFRIQVFISVHRATKYSNGAVLNFFKNSRYTGDKLTLLTNLSPVLLRPVINSCHGFSGIAGVIDSGDKFIASDKNKDAMEVGSYQG